MKNRRVFDCCTFFNERDLLRLRIEWLKDVVDIFVVSEGTKTFTGKDRVPEFRFEDYEIAPQRIRYVLVEDLAGPGCDAWINEQAQRNALLRGLSDLKEYDLVHVSDVDEIPATDVFEKYSDWWISAHLDQRLYYYQCNNLVVHKESGCPVYCTGAKITTGGNLRKFWGTPDNLRRKILADRNVFNRLRFRLTHRVIPEAGWHWSYMMTPEQIAGKIQSFSHTEFSGSEFSSIESVRRRVDAGVDPFDRGFRLQQVAVSEQFPPALGQLLYKRFSDYVRN